MARMALQVGKLLTFGLRRILLHKMETMMEREPKMLWEAIAEYQLRRVRLSSCSPHKGHQDPDYSNGIPLVHLYKHIASYAYCRRGGRVAPRS